MSKPQLVKPRRPKEPEILDLESMANSPGMKGMLSFLDISPEEKLARLTQREEGRPVEGRPDKGMPLTGIPDKDIPVQESPATAGPGATEELELALSTCYFQPPKAIPWKLAQDAHTKGQQLVYATMWRLGRPIGNRRGLVITIPALAAQVPIRERHCRDNVHDLVSKLAIDDLGPADNPSHGRKYLICDFDEIIERRRGRGLTHVIRNGHAVELVDSNGNPEKWGGVEGRPGKGRPSTAGGVPVKGSPYSEKGRPAKGTLLKNQNDSGRDDVIKESDDAASLYRKLTGRNWSEDDQAALDAIESVPIAIIKLAIVEGWARANLNHTRQINSFSYFASLIPELMDTGLREPAQAEIRLRYAISNWVPKVRQAIQDRTLGEATI